MGLAGYGRGGGVRWGLFFMMGVKGCAGYLLPIDVVPGQATPTTRDSNGLHVLNGQRLRSASAVLAGASGSPVAGSRFFSRASFATSDSAGFCGGLAASCSFCH